MKFQHIVFILAILFDSITAYFSTGYTHPDEQYQVIEFAGTINGANSAQDVP